MASENKASVMGRPGMCAKDYCGGSEDYFLHKPASECTDEDESSNAKIVECRAPQDHHTFVPATACQTCHRDF